MAAQAKPERAAAARRAFVRRSSLPAPWSAPRRLSPSRCRCCCSAASRCWRPEVGAPRAHGPPLDPHPGPAVPRSLQLPVLRSACAALCCAPGVIAWSPRAAWNPGPRPPFPSRTSGLALMPCSKTRGTCFKFLHLPNRSSSGLSQPHSLLVETARRPPAGPWGWEALRTGSSFRATCPPPPAPTL